MRIETPAVHSGRSVDPATGAVTPPIHMSTTFEREADCTYPKGFAYGRSSNPTRALLEKCLRDLEGRKVAAGFSSGAAALAAVFQSLAMGDHVIAPQDLYHGTALLWRERLARWGLHTSFVDKDGTWERVLEALRPVVRESEGRDATPSGAIIDRQSVRTTEKGGLAATTPAKRCPGASATS